MRVGLSYSAVTLPPQNVKSQIRAIYAIRHRGSGREYIGSAEHLVRRLRAHLSQMRRGVSQCVGIQAAWAKHGEDAFEFSVLEIVPADGDLIAREQAWIAERSPAYNVAACAGNGMKGRRHTAESIEKMRQNRLGKGGGPRAFSDGHRAALSISATRPKPWLQGRPMGDKQRVALSEFAKTRTGTANPRARAVEIGGVVYSLGKDAAVALGISHAGLIKKIRRGEGRYLD